MLLLDEADSLLRDRQGAQRSWEVTQAHEMLTQVETFHRVFIASTNLMDSLDAASMRRFDARIRLGHLGQQQAWEMFVGLAAALGLCADPELRSRLDRLTVLTPADFASLARQCRLAAPADAADLAGRLRDLCGSTHEPVRPSIDPMGSMWRQQHLPHVDLDPVAALLLRDAAVQIEQRFKAGVRATHHLMPLSAAHTTVESPLGHPKLSVGSGPIIRQPPSPAESGTEPELPVAVRPVTAGLRRKPSVTAAPWTHSLGRTPVMAPWRHASHEGPVSGGMLTYGDAAGASWYGWSGEGLIPPSAKEALRPILAPRKLDKRSLLPPR